METTIDGADLKVAAPKVTHSVVMISGDTAKRWLELNKRNRPIRQTTVERYRRSMQQGLWTFAGDPIRFDTDGNLIDGQHRLTALAETEGLSLPMLVVRGLPVDSQKVMDQGSKRTAADQLALAGHRNTAWIAASIKHLLLLDEGLLFRDRKASSMIGVAEIENWAGENRELLEFLHGLMTDIKANDAPPSIGGCAAMVFARIDPDDAAEFFRLLARGAGLEGHPIVTLDKRLARMRREGLKMSNRDYLALFFQAWNAWREDRSIKKFPRPIGGAWSEENFPVPR